MPTQSRITCAPHGKRGQTPEKFKIVRQKLQGPT